MCHPTLVFGNECWSSLRVDSTLGHSVISPASTGDNVMIAIVLPYWRLFRLDSLTGHVRLWFVYDLFMTFWLWHQWYFVVVVGSDPVIWIFQLMNSTTKRYLGFFQFGATINRTVRDICAGGFMWTHFEFIWANAEDCIHSICLCQKPPSWPSLHFPPNNETRVILSLCQELVLPVSLS